MKKIYVLALCSTLFLNVSCSSDDDSSGNEQPVSQNLSVEEGKTQLEENTIDVLNKIEEFKTNDALSEIIELAEYLNNRPDEKLLVSGKIVLKTVSNIANIEPSIGGIVDFNAKQAITLVDKEISDDLNEEKGVYTWNEEINDFEKTGTSDDIIYNIAYNNGKNAVFSFTDFNTTLAGANNDEELPTLAKGDLKIDGIIVFSQDFSASFEEGELIPVTIDNRTVIGDFSIVTSHANTSNTSIKQSFEFILSNEVILGYSLTSNGNFKGDLEGSEIDDVVDQATVNFQFLSANLEISAEDTDFISTSDLSIDGQIEVLNNSITAELSINNDFIARSEFYKDQDTYTDYSYEYNTQGEFITTEMEVTEDIVNARFLFADETTSDFDTYFDGSFTSLEDRFETVFDAYEELFGGI